MSENVVLKLAQLRVHEYADERLSDLMTRHKDAMECRDCEDFLRKGISAASFLRVAENIFRDADYRGIAPFDDALRSAVEALYAAWFEPRAFAEDWTKALQTRGYVPDNLAEFRKTCEEMQDAIERKDWLSHAAEARFSATSAEPW